jgi:hypothetical protein
MKYTLVFINALKNNEWMAGNIGIGFIFGGIWLIYIGLFKTEES